MAVVLCSPSSSLLSIKAVVIQVYLVCDHETSTGTLQWGNPGFVLLISEQDFVGLYFAGLRLLHVFICLYFLYTP